MENEEEEKLNKTHNFGRICVTKKFVVFIIHTFLLVDQI